MATFDYDYSNKDYELIGSEQLIENFEIGDNQPCMIIGEIGSNHNRDKSTVRKLIDACSDAGFDAVKFQIYDAEEAFSKNEMTTDVKLDHLYGENYKLSFN